MLIELCLSIACFAAGDAPAVSLEEARAKLSADLAGHAWLRLELGDGRGAARTFAALAAAGGNPARVRRLAFALLDLYENHGLPRDIRRRLVSPDRTASRKAVRELVEAFTALGADHALPANFHGWKVLGPASGCPVRDARAFAEGPGGTVLLLGDGLVWHDGRRWQVVPPDALRVYKPVEAVWIDRSGRTWLGSAARRRRAASFDEQLRRIGWDTLACFGRPRDGVPGRWRVFSGGRVASFADGKAGVWIAGRSRLALYDGWRARPVAFPMPYSPFRKVLASPARDDVWVVGLERLGRFDGRRWRCFHLGGVRPRGAVLFRGRPLVVASSGLLHATGGKAAFVSAPAGVGALTAASVGKDGRRVWCVTERGAVLRTDLKQWEIWDAPAGGRSPRWPPVIHCDRAGRVWLSRGRGIELSVGRLRSPRVVSTSARTVTLDPAPLVSAAGSGGWLRDGGPLEGLRGEEDEQGAGGDDLGGFAEDKLPRRDTPRDVLERLRTSPASGELFTRLMGLLKKQPDAAVQKEAFALAVRAQNPRFFEDPRAVRTFAEFLLDRGRPGQACVFLLDAWNRKPDATFAAAIRPALFEALVAMNFGEFARPGLLESDLRWPAGEGGRGPRATSIPLPGPGLRAVVFDVDPDLGRAAFEKAGLHRALVLAAKRAVLASMGDPRRWKRLVETCVRAGDAPAARRYLGLARRLLPDAGELKDIEINAAGQTRPADSVALAPFRWIRRVRIQMDSGLGPVVGREGTVHLFDESDGRRIALDAETGSRKKDWNEPLPVVGLLSGPRGLVPVVQLEDGRLGVRELPLRSGAKPVPRAVPIAGLTAAFDSFSATPVDARGVFYCFDGGLAKVDLNAAKVVWRNEEIVGGVHSSRTALERLRPTADGDAVFVISSGTVYRVDAATGQVRWKRDCRSRFAPAVAGGVVVVDAVPREVWGLSRKTGKRVWRRLAAGDLGGPPVSDGKRIFYATGEGRLTAADARTGRYLWHRPTRIRVGEPPSRRPKPTALLVHNGRLVACNSFGYFEFDGNSGALLRRLDVATARPMAAHGDTVVVATAPDRLVAVRAPEDGTLAGRMLALADEAAKAGRTREALEILRLVVNYVEPGNTGAFERALRLTSESDPRHAQALYHALLTRADPFTPDARRLMRKYLARAPVQSSLDYSAFELVARAHIERGGVRAAADAFAALSRRRSSPHVLRPLVELELAAGRKDRALEAARRLAAGSVTATRVAFHLLAAAGMEEAALELASRRVGPRSGRSLLSLCVALSGASGLFEKAAGMLERLSQVVPAPARAGALAYMLSNAGVAGRALRRAEKRLRRDLDRYRVLLEEHRKRLEALNRPDAAEAVGARLELLKKVRFP